MRRKGDKISIIVPAYNVENYIGTCLDSLINQTHTNLEIIVVNDGSTDNTSSKIDEYCQRDTRIRKIDTLNGGVSVARNLGMSYACGDYISFVDGDDILAPHLYEKAISSFMAYPDSDIFAFNVDIFYNPDKPKTIRPTSKLLTDIYIYIYIYDNKGFRQDGKQVYLDKEQALRKYIDTSLGGFLTTNKIITRELTEDIYFFPGKYYEDGPFFLEILFRSKGVVYDDGAYYFYRKGRAGATTYKPTNKLFDPQYILDELRLKYTSSPWHQLYINNYGIRQLLYVFNDIQKCESKEQRKDFYNKLSNFAKEYRTHELIYFGRKDYLLKKSFTYSLFLYKIVRTLLQNMVRGINLMRRFIGE